jgi:pre-mRNA-splicing factor 38B
VEPWLAGNARGPSTAFCLLYRLFELKPTEEEVQQTISHEDSAYIRAVRPAHPVVALVQFM